MFNCVAAASSLSVARTSTRDSGDSTDDDTISWRSLYLFVNNRRIFYENRELWSSLYREVTPTCGEVEASLWASSWLSVTQIQQLNNRESNATVLITTQIMFSVMKHVAIILFKIVQPQYSLLSESILGRGWGLFISQIFQNSHFITPR
jgi:hypothetical protein